MTDKDATIAALKRLLWEWRWLGHSRARDYETEIALWHPPLLYPKDWLR